MFAVATVASFGAASAAVGAVAAAVAAGEEVTAAAVAGAVLTTASTLANAGAAATSATLTADDAAGLSGHNFLSASQRNSLQTAGAALGIIGVATGAFGAVAAGGAATGEGEAAADAAKRFAVDELDPGVTPVSDPSESSSPVGFNESIGSISENPEPDPEIAAWRNTLDPVNASSSESSYGAFPTGPPMTEAETMLADPTSWEYSSSDEIPNIPAWRSMTPTWVGDNAESGDVSSVEDDAMSSSESGPAQQVTPASATTAAIPGAEPNLTQSVQSDFTLILNSNGELTVRDSLDEPAVMSSLSGSMPDQ